MHKIIVEADHYQCWLGWNGEINGWVSSHTCWKNTFQTQNRSNVFSKRGYSLKHMTLEWFGCETCWKRTNWLQLWRAKHQEPVPFHARNRERRWKKVYECIINLQCGLVWALSSQAVPYWDSHNGRAQAPLLSQSRGLGFHLTWCWIHLGNWVLSASLCKYPHQHRNHLRRGCDWGGRDAQGLHQFHE